MKIKIPTKQAAILQSKIFAAVEDETLKTWVVRKSQNGNSYLTHKPEQWYDRAILIFNTTNDALEISVDHWDGKLEELSVYGYYLGRFTEALFVHFSSDYETFEVYK